MKSNCCPIQLRVVRGNKNVKKGKIGTLVMHLHIKNLYSDTSQSQDAFEKTQDVANVSPEMSMSVLCSMTCHVTRIFQPHCPDFKVPVPLLACLLHGKCRLPVST